MSTPERHLTARPMGNDKLFLQDDGEKDSELYHETHTIGTSGPEAPSPFPDRSWRT